MSEEAKYAVPTQTKADLIHSTLRAAVGFLPGGSVALEYLNNLISPPLERRKERWMHDIAEGLMRAEETGAATAERLQDEGFITTLVQATQVAVRNHEKEKLDALRNAVLNTVRPAPPDDSVRQMFVAWVESFTVWHLRILAFLNDPVNQMAMAGKRYERGIVSSVLESLGVAHPELSHRREFSELLIEELMARGLLDKFGLHTMMSGDGWKYPRTTTLGKQFLKFISDTPR
jgi:hypothetical protein